MAVGGQTDLFTTPADGYKVVHSFTLGKERTDRKSAWVSVEREGSMDTISRIIACLCLYMTEVNRINVSGFVESILILKRFWNDFSFPTVI